MNADTTKNLNTDEHGSRARIAPGRVTLLLLTGSRLLCSKYTNDESLIQAMTTAHSSVAGVLLNKNSDVGDAIGALVAHGAIRVVIRVHPW